MPSNSFQKLKAFIDDLPIISSHEHHLPTETQKDMTLDRILGLSYVGWFTGRRNQSLPKIPDYLEKYCLPDDDPEVDKTILNGQRETFLDLFGYKTYWVWLEKGIQEIYGFNGSITPENWDEISQQIAHKHSDPLAHIKILKETARYLRCIQDTYWDYGSDLGYPDLFSPAMRTDMFITSTHPTITDRDGNNPFNCFPDAPANDFDDYLEFIKQLFISWRNNGAVTMKCAAAYDRPIQFGEPDYEKARQAFYKPINQIGEDGLIAYGDFMFDWFCKLNIELDVPFQIHTGLAKLAGSNPLYFEPILYRYPQIRFVLFHMGYPWYSEIAGLAHNHKNIFIDMVWGPIISTSAAVQALHQYIEVATSDKVGWGSDTWTSEGAVGALLAWRFVLTKVLSEMVDSGYINFTKAEVLAEKLMYKNNRDLYGI